MALQCQAWLQMRRYNELREEVSCWTFLKESTPAWIPWSLQILAAASLQYTQDSKEVAVDALCQL